MPQAFERSSYADILNKAHKGMPNRDLEVLGKKAAIDLLKKD
ncbi:MAG: hypothetical protein ACQET7_15045 [Thermodesulfobacteriota bacterium]